MKPSLARDRGGFTLIEVMIALTLIALVLANVGMVVRSSSSAYELQMSLSYVNTQANITLDRIALALMGSSPDTFIPTQQAPAWTMDVEYQKNLGIQDGEPVWSDPERIEYLTQQERVVWTEKPELPGELLADPGADERGVARHVRPPRGSP